jgi:hypothetical protein
MPEDELPDGRVTNKEVAQFVSGQLDKAREEIREESQEQQKTLRGWIETYTDSRLNALRDSIRDGERRFRVEMRAWLAGAVVLNALHPVGVATSVFGALGSVVGVHFFARFFNR